MGYALGATERTIKAHRHNVMEKVQEKSLAELVMIAERLGVLATSDYQTTARRNGPDHV